MSNLSTPNSAADSSGPEDQDETAADIVADYLQTMLESAFSEPDAGNSTPEITPFENHNLEQHAAPTDTADKKGVERSLDAISPNSAEPELYTVDQTPELPVWETDELEWLLVSAGRLSLAFPLIGLDSVQAFEKKVTPFSSALEWLPGLIRVKDTNIRLVDLASYLMHEPSELSECENVLVLNDSSWGLLIDRIVTTKKIMKDEMRRPATSGRYSWRFGALIDPVYTLIDPLRLCEALEHSLETG